MQKSVILALFSALKIKYLLELKFLNIPGKIFLVIPNLFLKPSYFKSRTLEEEKGKRIGLGPE